ncbi:MAG: hypothetical protein LUH53_03160, partial [Lachnospiraceae bacterium]|nr:hypothetical protein [Lachnospiraceae bacterium]
MKFQPAAMIDSENNVTKIERADLLSGDYNEIWLQDLLADNPYLLPVASFGPLYDNLICIGRETAAVGAGYIDCLFVSPAGGIVVVETKLFRNQEARRTVVAQIIEYAKAIRSWDCEKLDSIAENYFYKISGQSFRMIDKMAQYGLLTYNEEAGFVDAVNNNLSAGRILLLIVGDGIHSGVQELSDFINASSGNAFELALAEIEIYQSPSCVFAIPHLLTKTETVERRVYRISGSKPDKPLSETGFI